jgi:uncharacterized protein (TIGR02246 family)
MTDYAANKALVVEYFRRIQAGDAAGAADMFAQDGAIILPSKTLLPSETRGRDAIRTLIEPLSEIFPETGHKVILDLMTAEDDRVAATGHSESVHASGRLYNNHYHFLFIIRDGKILESREYMDTLHMTDVFFDDAKPE